MLTITLGSVVVQDPSWGGVGILPVPRTAQSRSRRPRYRGPREAKVPGDGTAISVLSVRCFGLVEITHTRRVV